VTTLKPEYEVVQPGLRLWPENFTLGAYTFIFEHTKIGIWYFNSIVTTTATTAIVVGMGAACGYAISQLRFPGRMIIYGMIMASYMVPLAALIVTHFILISDLGMLNSWGGIMLELLIQPVTVIVYKQFFDSVPREYREAALVDGANDFQLFFRVFMPMNWGITTALSIIAFIFAWNQFFWPFLAQTSEDMMTVTVGITQVHDAFGVQYARNLAGAVTAGLPVALTYIIFQRRVTQAIALQAGIKG